MKNILIIFIIFFIVSCSKPKVVLICGNHVCVNKTEAEQYFEENLSIEVKVVDQKEKKNVNLIELNLRESELGEKEIILTQKKDINKDLKILSNDEVIEIKKKVNKRKKINKLTKKNTSDRVQKKRNNSEGDLKITKSDTKNNIIPDNVNNKKKDVVDVCTILKKCSIDEISKFLLKEGKKKNFPDITTRQ